MRLGRMDDATAALRLLLTADPEEAGTLAARMERFNDERRAEQERILAEAMEQVDWERPCVHSRAGSFAARAGIPA